MVLEMSTQYREPLIIGCHHKTGTNFLGDLAEIIVGRLWRRDQVIVGSSQIRKQPLSKVVHSFGKDFHCYVNPWFEHDMDVPPSSVRFLHLIRHPVKWVRSAYLYHKKGGPSEKIRWLDWRVFRIGTRQLSYYELLNSVAEDAGIAIEAVRSFPEVAGTARSACTSAAFPLKQTFSLEQFQADFDSHIRALCEFVGFDLNQTSQVLAKLDFSKAGHVDQRPNVTHGSELASDLEARLTHDPGFLRLYADPIAQMGFTFDGINTCNGHSLLDDALIGRILAAKDHFLTDVSSDEAQAFLRSESSSNGWLAYALQSFGNGHLMMYDFIQQMVESREFIANSLYISA